MKSIIVSLLLLCSVSIASAQIGKGTWMAGGAGYLTGGLGGGAKVFNSSIQPQFGYFPVKNLGIGIFAQLGYNSSIINKSFSLGAGSFVRYYVPLSQKFILFPYAEYSANHVVTRQEGRNDRTRFDNQMSVGLGASWFITKNIAFEPVLGIQTDGKGNNSLLGRFGFQLYFNR